MDVVVGFVVWFCWVIPFVDVTVGLDAWTYKRGYTGSNSFWVWMGGKKDRRWQRMSEVAVMFFSKIC